MRANPLVYHFHSHQNNYIPMLFHNKSIIITFLSFLFSFSWRRPWELVPQRTQTKANRNWNVRLPRIHSILSCFRGPPFLLCPKVRKTMQSHVVFARFRLENTFLLFRAIVWSFGHWRNLNSWAFSSTTTEVAGYRRSLKTKLKCLQYLSVWLRALGVEV